MIDFRFRPARVSDCNVIAQAIAISSGGYAQLGWKARQGQYPGLDLLEIGSRCYALDIAPFTWRNCVIAEANDPLGVMLAYGIDAPASDVASGDPQDVDYPVAMEITGSWYICGVTVFEPWRGNGIGSRFLELAEDQARQHGCSRLSLIAFAQNAGSVRLYERNGFSVVERRTLVPHRMLEYTGEALLMAAPVHA